jgi:hypothetical protein
MGELSQGQETDPTIKSREEKIASANSIEELALIVEEIDFIDGSQETYQGEQVAEYIRLAAKKDILPNRVTRTHGIKDKLMELMQKESETK